MIGSLGWTELIVITAVIIVFLGKGDQLPEITRALGEAVREFKDAANSNPETVSSGGESEEESGDGEENEEIQNEETNSTS